VLAVSRYTARNRRDDVALLLKAAEHGRDTR